ncbi:putative Hydrogenase expression/formation protein HoxV [Georgfuchsia toluolica]|uniref:Hydrogenase expression/formation protein HoxV n=1 Tax=Georgfuchsia toluolica TaxID=424218 RepID=A0A916N1V3_9PROT|nr:hypothetical protein [Georgfuchsia toluolica]CAG4883089.1 putative Hydrogenase expression/formation protein HoxV [Georgfuchsia toluolica]
MSMEPGFVRLHLALSADGLRVASVQVECHRPDVSTVLDNKPASAVEKMVPLLYAVCGKAHGLAASLAMKAARGEAIARHRNEEVARESAREHLWHLLGVEDGQLLAAGCRCLQAENPSAALANFIEPLLGMPPRDWLAFETSGALDDWATAQPGVLARGFQPHGFEPHPAAVPLLPALEAAESLSHWPRLDGVFSALPVWQGSAAETGAIARQCDSALVSMLRNRPLAQRKAARLRELLLFAQDDNISLQAGDASAHPVAPGRGRALIQTARGLLMHEVSLRGEITSDYIIVAPTEWNFHPQGTLSIWLRNMGAERKQVLHESMAAAVAALDPCVPWLLQC